MHVAGWKYKIGLMFLALEVSCQTILWVFISYWGYLLDWVDGLGRLYCQFAIFVHDIEQDEKLDMLHGKSERFARTFGLWKTKPATPLQVMKNPQVCGDWHIMTTYILNFVWIQLLLRHSNCFHVFKDGALSSGDYWKSIVSLNTSLNDSTRSAVEDTIFFLFIIWMSIDRGHTSLILCYFSFEEVLFDHVQ